jgi:serine O-acetyltransferase
MPRKSDQSESNKTAARCHQALESEETKLTTPLRQILQADLYRYTGATDRRAFVSAYLHEPGFRFTYYLRKVAFYSTRKRSFGIFGYVYNRLLYHHYRFKYGFDISPATSIGPGLYIGHFGGVVISPHAVLGANVNIAQGVTIGATSRGKRLGAPTLEDRVWVGAHAIIVGKVTIGREALIAPGAYVNFDVPAKSVVLGNPGQVVSSSGSQGYVNRTIDNAETEEAGHPN